MYLLVSELCFALKHDFQPSLGLGMPFFLSLMKVETLVVTYMKILLLRKNGKYQAKRHRSET